MFHNFICIQVFSSSTNFGIKEVHKLLKQRKFDEAINTLDILFLGGFLAPAVETAFNRDLKPVTKLGFTRGIEQPKVKVLTQADIDAAKMGGAIAEEEPKQTVYTPIKENKNLKK